MKEFGLLIVDGIKTCLNPSNRASVADDKPEQIRQKDDFLSTFRTVMQFGQKHFEKMEGRLNEVETFMKRQSPQTTSTQDQTNYPLVVKSEQFVNGQSPQLASRQDQPNYPLVVKSEQPQQPHYSPESQHPVIHPLTQHPVKHLVPKSTPQFVNHSVLPPQSQSRSSESQVIHVAPLQHQVNYPLVPQSTPQLMDQLVLQPQSQPHSSIYTAEPTHFATFPSDQQQSMNPTFSANQLAVITPVPLFQGPVQTPQIQNIQGISLHNPRAGSAPPLSFYNRFY